MFAKIFSQIFDSSIAEDWQVRCVFTDLLTLCDINGVVDMTPEAIARRTNVPIEIILRALEELQRPDPKSRSPEDDGRRIRLLDEHRNWGWMIINYEKYRLIASDEQRRQKNLDRVNRYRSKKRADEQPVTPCNADVTPAHACHAMQKQKQKQKQKEEVPPTPNGEVDAVAEIYKLYPLKVKRPKAYSAIRKALKSVSSEFLMERTAEYAKRTVGYEYIPYPASWYNGECYNDDPETWVRHTNGESEAALRRRQADIKSRMDILKRRHYSETEGLRGGEYLPKGWRDEKAKAEYLQLSKESKSIDERIAKQL